MEEAAESMDTGPQHPQGKNHQVTVRFTLTFSVFKGLMFDIWRRTRIIEQKT